jgi:hypothetical protein
MRTILGSYGSAGRDLGCHVRDDDGGWAAFWRWEWCDTTTQMCLFKEAR